MSNHHSRRPFVARTIRRLSVPILLFWLATVAITNAAVPQLEEVGRKHNVAASPPDAPSLLAMKHMGTVFHEFDTDSLAMIVLEGDKPLADDAHRFYDTVIQRLAQDTKHVQHIQDLWGDPLTSSASQSTDGQAAYVQVYLAGDQGSALANESVASVRDIVRQIQPPKGVQVYVTGPAPQFADQFTVGSKSTAKVTGMTFVVIAVMLLWVYRAVVSMILVLLTVFIELAAARGVVAFWGTPGSSGCRYTRPIC